MNNRQFEFMEIVIILIVITSITAGILGSCQITVDNHIRPGIRIITKE